jgi:hypothetical protein
MATREKKVRPTKRQNKPQRHAAPQEAEQGIRRDEFLNDLARVSRPLPPGEKPDPRKT